MNFDLRVGEIEPDAGYQMPDNILYILTYYYVILKYNVYLRHTKLKKP
jgi:hypothetical protein